MAGARSRAWGTEQSRTRPSEAQSNGVIRCGGLRSLLCAAHGVVHDPPRRVCPLCYATQRTNA